MIWWMTEDMECDELDGGARGGRKGTEVYAFRVDAERRAHLP